MRKKAEYRISSSVNEGIPEIVITGNATDGEFVKMLSDVDTILTKNGARKAIFDIRSLNKHIEYNEIYHLSGDLIFLFLGVESAIVDVPENAPLRTAVKDARLPWKCFTDIDEARAWQKSKSLLN